MDEGFRRLARVIGATFEIDSDTVTPEMTAEDVERWDSLNHLRLIMDVEKEFGVRLSMTEVMELENVGDLHAALRTNGAFE